MPTTRQRWTSIIGPGGEVVIPARVREALGVLPGDEVRFSMHDDHAHMERVSPGERLRAYFDSLPDRAGGAPLSPDQLRRLREEAYEDRFRDGLL